jgi:hypothetical protein
MKVFIGRIVSFILIIFIVIVGANFIINCNKNSLTTEQFIESKIIYNEDGKEMQKIKKQIYSNQVYK